MGSVVTCGWWLVYICFAGLIAWWSISVCGGLDCWLGWLALNLVFNRLGFAELVWLRI